MAEGALPRLRRLLLDRSVRRGDFVLASGQRSSYYIDCRLTTMSAEGQRLIGELGWQAIRDAGWRPRAVGGLTMGADPVAMAVMHAAGRPIDAFVVRKAAKAHGMQRQIEGPDVVGKRVLVVEDTTTTGNSPLTAVKALRDVGAIVVGVATVVDRATGAGDVIAAEGLEYRSLLGLPDLNL